MKTAERDAEKHKAASFPIPLLGVLLLAGPGAMPAAERAPGFRIELIQAGRRIDIRDHQATLDSSSFDILVHLDEKGGVFVHASFEPTVYERARKGEPLGETFALGKTTATEMHNESSRLFFGDDRSHMYWYYKNDHDHAFNEVRKEKGNYICRRAVADFWAEGASVQVQGSEQPHVYLVFVAGELQLSAPPVERQRDYLKLFFPRAELLAEFRRAVELSQQDRLEEAEAAFEALVTKAPSVKEIHYNLGHVRFLKREMPSAEAAFVTALEIDPDYSDAASALANVRLESRHEGLEREIPSSAGAELESVFAQGVQAADDRRWDEAEAAFQDFLAKSSEMPEAHFNLAFALIGKKDYSSAQAALERAIHARRDYPEAYLALARVHLGRNQRDKALEVLSQGAESSPASADIAYQLGLMLFDAAKIAESLVALRKANSIESDLLDVHYHIGRITVAEGSIPDAVEELEKYLSQPTRNPGYARTARKLLEAFKPRP